MTWDDFLPFIWPSCTACPRETVIHHTRQAAIDFCARTHVWREQLDTLLADGFSTSYTLALDDQVELAKLLTVTVKDSTDTDEVLAEIVELIEGREAIREGSTELLAWTDNRRVLNVSPAPINDAQIRALVALKPSQGSFSFSDDVFRHYADDIAAGALARLHSMPGCEWTNLDVAAANQARFKDAIASAGQGATRGFGRRTRNKTSRFF